MSIKIGERLKQFRLSLEMNQKEIANGLPIKSGTWSSYEKGNSEPSLGVLQALTRRYGVDLNWLINGEGSMNNLQNTQKYIDIITSMESCEMDAKTILTVLKKLMQADLSMGSEKHADGVYPL